MRSALILVLLLGAGACGSSEPTRGSKPDTSQHVSDTDPLRDNLLANQATLDGRRITDLRLTGHCTAVFVTAQESVSVNWKDLGDLITLRDNGRIAYTLPSDGRDHVLSVRETTDRAGDTGTRIGMSLSLFDRECGGVRGQR
jgi:hypothetical protein